MHEEGVHCGHDGGGGGGWGVKIGFVWWWDVYEVRGSLWIEWFWWVGCL